MSDPKSVKTPLLDIGYEEHGPPGRPRESTVPPVLPVS